MKTFFAVIVLALVLSVSLLEAQTVYVPHGGRVIAVPLVPAVPGTPVPVSVMPPPAEGGLVRLDGLPAGAVLTVNGHVLGGTEVGGGWIALPPGPHFLNVALPGGAAIRMTIVTPTETSGYQVVPKP